MRTAGALFAAVFSIASSAEAGAQASSACFSVVNVDAWDVLYIRSKPDHRSAAAGAIAPDHTGIIRSTGPCRPLKASSRRQWCPVDYFPLPDVKKSGFVKAYFIRPAACPGS